MTVNQATDTRPQPAATDIEQALISSIIFNRNAIERVSEFLRPEHFFDPFFAKIFQICLVFDKEGRDINRLTLKEYSSDPSETETERQKRERKIDDLAFAEVPIVNTADYGRQIVDRYIRRKMIDLAYTMVDKSYTIALDTDAVDNLEYAENQLFMISADGQSDGGLKGFDSSIAMAIENIAKAKLLGEKLPGVATHFDRLDQITCGFNNTDLIILAGRPAMGKTALATCMAFNAAKDFYEDNKKAQTKTDLKSVAFFSLEMSAAQLASRILSSQAQIDGTKIRNGKISQEEFNKINEVALWMQKFPLYIDDTPGLTVNAIRTRAKRLKRGKTGLGLIIIDYLQLIEGDSRNGGQENRVQEVSKMTRELKLMAKELNVPVVVLSQLNRGVESRDEKIPQLADLRESGSIEQDADIVMAVYREWYYLPKEIVQKPGESNEKYNARVADLDKRKSDLENIAEVLVLKNRHGKTANIKLSFVGQYSSFNNLLTN